MAKIFVNYRRQQDGGWPANSIAKTLEREFGSDRVFLDVKNVPPAGHWPGLIQSEIERAAALVIVMGEDWHKIHDPEAGSRRIDKEDDWVRKEIRTAITGNIPIFILLLDDAKLPKPEWLPNDIQPLLDAQARTIHSATADNDLEPVLVELEALTMIPRQKAASSSRTRLAPPNRVREEPVRVPALVPSRAPVVIAIEEASARINKQDLLAAERHLTVVLQDRHLSALRSVEKRLAQAISVDAIKDLGLEAWETLSSASPRLDGLFKKVAQAEQEEGFPQPIAWTGHLELLTTIYRAILVAFVDDGGGISSFLSVDYGAHYFHPLRAGQSHRSMQRRMGDGQSRVRIGSLIPSGGDDGVRLADALENEVVLVSAENVDRAIREIANLIPRQPASPTRVVMGFGYSAVDASLIDAVLAVVPCVSFAGPGLRERTVLRETSRSLTFGMKTQATPVIVSRVRRQLVAEQLSPASEATDLEVLRDALGWSAWSWVGRPLFSGEFGEVRKAAYPHLMDLRDVASRDWYYARFADIPEDYQRNALAAREQKRRFHLYVSGAGGTGKSCFLKSIYDMHDIDNWKVVLPVWYKVHAPSSNWDEVETQIKRGVRAALERRFGALDHGLLSEADDRKELGTFLLDLIEKLRSRKDSINQIVLFIDQLERTFESGENPEPRRLTTISENIVALLKQVGVDRGVQFFIASRKQYLADFLSSFKKADEIKLHFNVLQTLSIEKEGTAFVNQIVGWCNQNNLTVSEFHIDPAAAQTLARIELGHPLNIMLALIQLLSEDSLPDEISESAILKLSPWERRFRVDESLMGKDDLDWYFFLSMAHARTEIVRREEVLWRLGLVRDLARRIKELGPGGVLERLWLLGHLGRTIHPRPQGRDSARFLEFFHANLRDHLVANVMSRTEEPSGTEPSGGDLLRRGMPASWRALDRLREIARDWEQIQQPLVKEDIRALMDHKEVFAERGFKVLREDRSPANRLPHPQKLTEVEVENFYLLFMRDVEERREIHFKAAKECVAYSALVHDVDGRWALRTLFPRVAPGPERDDSARQPREGSTAFDDSQIGCCRRWLRPGRADGQSRLRILHYLVELRDSHANRLLAQLVFDPAADDEPWQQLASILAEPLVAATHRSAFLTDVVQYLLDEGVSLQSDGWHTERLGAFLVATCAGERHAVSHLLETLPKEVEVLLGDTRLEAAVRDLAEPERIERWLRDLAAASPVAAAGDREIRDGAELELRVGEGLARHIDRGRLQSWMQVVAERLGVPIPPLACSRGEISNHRHTDVATRSPAPPGHEMQLLIRGRLIGLGRFFPDRVQTLTRDWDGAEENGAIAGFNEALWEPVRWVEEKVLDDAKFRQPKWTFDHAAIEWLQALLRRYLPGVFSYDEVYRYLRNVAGASRAVLDLQVLSNVLFPVWTVIVKLVRERVPLAERDVDLLGRLIELVRESETFDPALMTLRLREHVRDDLCRAFADGANQLFVLLLDPVDEQWLASKLSKTRMALSLDKLTHEETLRTAAVVRERFEAVAQTDHAYPILVCEDNLRAALFELLQSFDPRIFVLSYTELSPNVRLTSRGVIRRFSPVGGPA
jgi:hypothetical protein